MRVREDRCTTAAGTWCSPTEACELARVTGTCFLGHAAATLAKLQVPEVEQHDVVAFVQSLKKEIVE